jgi:Holliday junction resolvase RusA-like endonuclease
MSGLSFDEMVRSLERDYGLPRDRAEATARAQFGIHEPECVAAAPTTRRELSLPVTISLPWSLLVSDNEKCEVRGDKHMLKSRYRQAKATIPARVREQLGDVAPVGVPLALVARVYVPDNRSHDVCNFAKLVHDALQGVVYQNDSQLWDTRWIHSGVMVDAPRAEIIIAPAGFL